MNLLNQLNQEVKNKDFKAIPKPFSSFLPNTTMTQETINQQPVMGFNDEVTIDTKPIDKKPIEVFKYMTEITRYPDGREFIKCYRVGKDTKNFAKKPAKKKNLEEVNMTECQEEIY